MVNKTTFFTLILIFFLASNSWADSNWGTMVWGQDNWYADTDNDGLSDSDEIEIYNTSPDNPDTDNDGLDDGIEVAYWGADWNADPDGDSLVNLLDQDSDNDGLSDGMEVNILGTDPAMADTDSNGTPDGDEDSDGDGFSNAEEIECESDPADPGSRCTKGLPWLMLLLEQLYNLKDYQKLRIRKKHCLPYFRNVNSTILLNTERL